LKGGDMTFIDGIVASILELSVKKLLEDIKEFFS